MAALVWTFSWPPFERALESTPLIRISLRLSAPTLAGPDKTSLSLNHSGQVLWWAAMSSVLRRQTIPWLYFMQPTNSISGALHEILPQYCFSLEPVLYRFLPDWSQIKSNVTSGSHRDCLTWTAGFHTIAVNCIFFFASKLWIPKNPLWILNKFGLHLYFYSLFFCFSLLFLWGIAET